MDSAQTFYNPIPSDELRAWLHLANVQFSPRLLIALLKRYDQKPEAILAATDAELQDIPELQERHLARLRDPANAVTSSQWDWMQRPDVHVVCLCHPAYPRPLRDIPDPPPILFVRGSLLEVDRFAVGLVGSRRATPYGRAAAHRIARELAQNGLTVVSGGAIGIDTAAHKGALESAGRTIAVLGCGLDVDYPRDNRLLFDQIALNGALLTEYPPGAQPENWRFPARNRVISGLSQGILVVEAPQPSGALITARYAGDHGRPVMAIPGNIDRSTSVGTNNLLKEGAVLITETADILRALNMVVVPARPQHQKAFELNLDTSQPDSPSFPNSTFPNAANLPIPAAPRPAVSLPPAQAKLLEALSLTPRHIDSVALETAMTAVQAGVEMTLLELSGHVRRLPGNTYIRAL